MRYIADSSGYVKEVSFGADIVCGGQECTEYAGAVPSGYASLEAWYIAEVEKLYRWKIVSGNLTLDSAAVAPVEGDRQSFLSVGCSAATTLGTDYSKITCGNKYYGKGNLLQMYDGGIKCLADGYVIVDTTLTVTGLTAGDAVSVAPKVGGSEYAATYAQSGTRTYTSVVNTRPTWVDAGDVIYLQGCNMVAARGTVDANNRTLLTVQYIG